MRVTFCVSLALLPNLSYKESEVMVIENPGGTTPSTLLVQRFISADSTSLSYNCMLVFSYS